MLLFYGLHRHTLRESVYRDQCFLQNGVMANLINTCVIRQVKHLFVTIGRPREKYSTHDSTRPNSASVGLSQTLTGNWCYSSLHMHLTNPSTVVNATDSSFGKVYA